jgi:hypothetical protein
MDLDHRGRRGDWRRNLVVLEPDARPSRLTRSGTVGPAGRGPGFQTDNSADADGLPVHIASCIHHLPLPRQGSA